MGQSSYNVSPPMIREQQNLDITVVPKMNCEHHLIHLQIDQFTVVLTLANAKRLAISLRATIDEVNDEVDNKAMAWLKDYHEVG